jgi:iron complex outermembrane receptor protein
VQQQTESRPPAPPVVPQTQTQGSATAQASDAFGERVGIEQIGLYGEGQVRGFDLQASGAYRIDGHYFARASALPDAVASGVGVRVGVTAAALDLPSPSGVVVYRLRDPGVRRRGEISLGVRDYETYFVEGLGSWVSEDGKVGVVADVLARPRAAWAVGTSGQAFNAGAVGKWLPDQQTRVRAFAALYHRDYDGDFGIRASEDMAPPHAAQLVNFSPEWAGYEAKDLNFGLLADRRFGKGWTLDLSAVRSMHLSERADFTLLSVDRSGDASATLLYSAPRDIVSDSAEARLAKVFTTGALDHRISISARGRRSRTETVKSVAFDAGLLNITEDRAAPGAPPSLPTGGVYGEDAVDQITGSIGYGLVWNDKVQLRLGAHRTRYDKAVTAFGGARSERREESWLYNASLVWALNERFSVFASYVTGLEETGTAPSTAVNRNEVLPPVEATQFEAGLRYALTDTLTLIGAAFDVSKPTNGLRANGVYGPVGEVRHRGVEASLTGRVGEDTNIVLGAVRLDPEVSGPLVDQGLVGAVAPGLSELTATMSVEHRLNSTWSVDGAVTYNSERQANTRNSFTTPAQTLTNLGARARFTMGDTPVTFRFYGSNIFNASGYWASGSEILWPVAPRTWRASLTFSFG